MFKDNPFFSTPNFDFGDLLRNHFSMPPAFAETRDRVVVDVETLISKGVSHIRHGDKLYRIECTEYKVSK